MTPTNTELAEALRNALEWIDAVPKDVVLPAMPGFDRDKVGSLLATIATYEQAQAEPMDMALCEATSVVLREGQLYRFRRVGDCETCAELSKQSLEAYGTPKQKQDWHARADAAYRYHRADAMLAERSKE